ncbi:MAG: hypothetical protein AB7S75_22735 [Desulfococcaceae bacterium]
MISVPAVYENGNILFTEPVHENRRYKVIVTFIENLEENRTSAKFVGSLTQVGETAGDLTEPFEDEWETD